MAKRKTARQKVQNLPLTNFCLVFCAVFVIITSIVKLTEFIITSQKPYIPKLELSLNDVTLEEVDINSKDIKYPGNQLSLTTKDSTLTLQDVEIKGRGNHTWNQPKKPYQITLDSRVGLFNLPPARKWLLLADYLDQTHLRNNIALHLSELFGNPFTPKGQYVELYIDGSYRGLYYITEKVEVKKSRLHLHDEYGILVELDDSYGSSDECLYDNEKNCIVLKDAVNNDKSFLAHQKFIDSLNELYSAIQEKDYHTISSLIDIDSFAKYYLVNEFTNNPDAYSTSFFMYQDGLNSPIHAGPVWDFDIALGNDYWRLNGLDTDVALSPLENTPFKQFSRADDSEQDTNSDSSTTHAKSTTIVYSLLDFPEFRARIKEIYQETLSTQRGNLLDYIKFEANYIRDAALRDQARWKLDFEFDDEVNSLLDWVSKRLEHFEATYGKDSSDDFLTPTNSTDSATQFLNLTPISEQLSEEPLYPLL